MGWFKNTLKNVLKGGFRVGYSSGKAFDPRDQKRTDAIQDIMNHDRVRCTICYKKIKRMKAIRCIKCFKYICSKCEWKKKEKLCKTCGKK